MPPRSVAPGNSESTEQRLKAIEDRLDALARELERIEGRIAGLEASSQPRPGEPARPEPRSTAAQPTEEPDLLIPPGTVALVGRTLIVLGGAYLLRAITPISASAQSLGGVAVGLAYGVAWVYQADRTAAAGQRLSAVFHALAAAMIVCPLIWETTLRFKLLPANAAAATLVLFLVLGLFVGRRHGVIEIGWITSLFAITTVLSLLLGSRDLMPFTAALLAAAVAVEGFAVSDTWLGLRWPAALALDAALALAVAVSLRPGGPPESYRALPPLGVSAIAMTLALLYLCSTAIRSLARGLRVTAFEIVQVAAALVLGFGGTAKVIAFNGGNPAVIAVSTLLVGAGCYAAAFAAVGKHPGRERDFYFYTSFAILLTLAATCALLEAATSAVVWSAVAVAALALGRRTEQIVLKFHGAAYMTAAAFVAGLVACAAEGLLGGAAGPWTPLATVTIFTAAVALAGYCILTVAEKKRDARIVDLLPRAALATIVVWSAAGIAARGLARATAAAPGPGADPALLGAGRTAVLAATAVTLAWLGRRWRLEELTWLVYPVLIGAGARLLLEDLGHGRPETLFLTLALYGGALIATPRLMRRDSTPN